MRSSSYEEINSQKKGVSSAELSLGVMRARKIQDKRFQNEDISYNSQMRPSHMKKYCNIDEDSEYLMKTAFDNLKLSVRAYNKILKVSRTVADIEGCEKIKKEHIAEAISYRCELENVG